MIPIAQIRHDLRTPLNHILGYSELLGEELAERGMEAPEELARVKTAAHQLLALLNTHLGDDHLQPTRQEAPETVPSEAWELQAAPDVSLPQKQNDQVEAPQHGPSGRILIVDDSAGNREMLHRMLIRQGHRTAQAENGALALELLAAESFDMVLLDIMMPVMDGYAVLREMKTAASLRHIPVIMISALDEIDSVVRCIESGAEDYLPKPFNSTLLRARIGACLEKKTLRDQEQEHLRTIQETQKRLAGELTEAARYVRSILPEPVTEPFRIDWHYEPSSELAGDSFGYHWIDDEHFAIYLLDVCGHGVGAALLSVSAINTIRTGGLNGIDFRDPGAVLGGLNNAFPMERNNEMYFTIWYGVYHAPTRTLHHASAGHPSALLLPPGGGIQEVGGPGMIIGFIPGVSYVSKSLQIPSGATLIVLCDGTYEVIKQDGSLLEFQEFKNFMAANGSAPDAFLRLLTWLKGFHGPGPLDDDFSLVRIQFP
jgi:sigma-B regulation protein RsbU (phosphoserine phosphatase)